MENKTPRYADTNKLIYLYSRWITQLQEPEDAGALEGVQACLDVLLEQPTVDAVPVMRGRWEKDPDMRRMDGHIYDYRCSTCHSPANKGCYNNNDRFTNYCPNCGAKMDSVV